MAETNTRIEQFKKMAEADPENELGHFSLGKAYLDAGMHAEAIQPLRRAIELNPNVARVYELLATALLAQNKREEAIQQLKHGVEVATARGDMMPKKEMIQMLKGLGVAVAESESSAPQQAVGTDQVLCSHCGNVGPKLAKPPFSNDLGKQIFAKICQPCWQQWIRMGTKVINELRLPLSDPQAQKIYDQHMKEFLNL